MADAHGFSLLNPGLSGWRMAGPGGFAPAGDAFESYGGPGLLWYAAEVFDDFILRLAWRATGWEDNSGVFLRCPPLDADPQPAIDGGYEVQIDDRGLDPESGRLGSPLHLTGAIYGFAPVLARASHPIGSWNEFEIVARGPSIAVALNGIPVARLDGAIRRPSGHIGLQNHHEGSAVQFRALRLARI